MRFILSGVLGLALLLCGNVERTLAKPFVPFIPAPQPSKIYPHHHHHPIIIVTPVIVPATISAETPYQQVRYLYVVNSTGTDLKVFTRVGDEAPRSWNVPAGASGYLEADGQRLGPPAVNVCGGIGRAPLADLREQSAGPGWLSVPRRNSRHIHPHFQPLSVRKRESGRTSRESVRFAVSRTKCRGESASGPTDRCLGRPFGVGPAGKGLRFKEGHGERDPARADEPFRHEAGRQAERTQAFAGCAPARPSRWTAPPPGCPGPVAATPRGR